MLPDKYVYIMNSNRITVSIGASILTFILILSACAKKTEDDVHVSSIRLDKSYILLEVGETRTVTVAIKPDEAADKSIMWSSSNKSVVTVNDGVINAVAVGEAIVSAEADGKSATCAVTVVPFCVEVESIILDKVDILLKVGETTTLTATVNPSDATDRNFTWDSDDTGVVTVDNGVVKAVGIGSATVVATAGNHSAYCRVSVVPTPITGISLDKTSVPLKLGESVVLMATVSPSDATDNTVTWNSDDNSVATVDDGIVKAVGVGNTTIVAKAGNYYAKCFVYVIPVPITGLSLSETCLSLQIEDLALLAARLTPSDASADEVQWSISDETVASIYSSISPYGYAQVLVVAHKEGTATVSAKAGGLAAFCEVTVLPNIQLNKDTFTEQTTEEDLF